MPGFLSKPIKEFIRARWVLVNGTWVRLKWRLQADRGPVATMLIFLGIPLVMIAWALVLLRYLMP